MAKRTKYVVDVNAVAHLWVGHNLSGAGQDGARNGGRNNFYFSGPTIYSYGSHFPVASFVTNGKKKAIQFTTQSYSVTTSRHIGIVRDAIRGNDIPVFHVQFPTDGRHETARGIADYLSRIGLAIADQTKSRATYRTEKNRNSALALIAECKAYCKFWKIKLGGKYPKVPDLPADFADRQKKERDRQAIHLQEYHVRSKALAAQWVKDHAERIAKDTAAINDWNENYETHIADWLAGGELNYPVISNYYSATDTGIPKLTPVPTLLRIRGNEVETSRHASFPLSHAQKALQIVDKCIERGKGFKSNGRTIKLGLYELQSITVGTPEAIEAGGAIIKAGCHVVPYSSVLLIRPEVLAYVPKTEAVEA